MKHKNIFQNIIGAFMVNTDHRSGGKKLSHGLSSLSTEFLKMKSSC